MAFDFCNTPPNPASARSLDSFFPLSHGHNPLKNYEFTAAFMRCFQFIQMATSPSYRFPRENEFLVAGTANSLVASTLTDSDATFTNSSAIKRCGIITSILGARIRIYIKNDPRYVATATIKEILSDTTLRISNWDFVERGQVASLADIAGCQYAIFEQGDIDCYDRWVDPPNARGHIAQYQLACDSHKSGSFGSFGQKIITLTGPPTGGSYTLNTGGGSTAEISFDAGTTGIGSTISLAVSGLVSISQISSGIFAVCFGPGVSNTLTVNVDSLIGGSVAVSFPTSPTLYDARMLFAGPHKTGPLVNNLFIDPQPNFPDQPTAFDLVIFDSGSPADSAELTAIVTPRGGLSLGEIDVIGIVHPGSGYTSVPTVTLPGGATATAIVETGTVGTLTKILVSNGGFNYSGSPTVTIDGDGTGAAASAIVNANGAVIGFTITNNGTGYTNVAITITDTIGVGASAIGVLVGGVSAITVTSRGSGFTVPPIPVLTGGGGTGAEGRTRLVSGPITSITVDSGGSLYQSEPVLAISSTGIGDHGGSATAVLTADSVTSAIVDTGGDYSVLPTITPVGGGGDMSVHRFPITANTQNSITVASIGSWVPSVGFYYDVIAHDPWDGNSIWNPTAMPGARQIWNTGAYQSETGLTHRDNDDIGNYPQAAEVVYFDGGDAIPPTGICEGPTAFNAADLDVINGCCDPDCCSRGHRFYAPNIWKSVRYWQKAIAGIGPPWVYIPLWSDPSIPPPYWTFSDVMVDQGFNTAGFYVPYHKTFKLMQDSIAWITDLDEDGEPTGPGVGTASTPAAATSHLTSTAVSSVTIDDGGHNQSIPLIGFTGGGGSGAKGHAVLTGDVVSSVIIDSGGAGYTSAPTVNFTLGGVVALGSWSRDDESSNYLFYDYGVGETGPVFAAGDVSQYQGYQDYQQTLPGFRADQNNPTADYLDKKWIGTCGTNPPNLRFKGKTLKSSDPLSENYNLYGSTRISSDGTGIWTMMPILSSETTDDVVSQVTVGSRFWDFWFQPETITPITGTATGGSTVTLMDSTAPFTIDDLGATVTIVHSGDSFSVIIDGVSVDGKTIYFPAAIPAFGAGDAYSFDRNDTQLDRQSGIVSAGASDHIIDSNKIGSPYFASDIYPEHAILEVFHENGDSTQSRWRFWITDTDQSLGKLIFDTLDGIVPAVADRWQVKRIRRPHQFAKIWATFKPSPLLDIGLGDGVEVDVQIRGNSISTLFLIDPPSGFVWENSDSVTVKLNTFRPGSVLMRDIDNKRWLDTATQTETRTDPETGLVPPFKNDNFLNKPGYIDRYGFRTIMTITTTDMWNQMYTMLSTLINSMEGFGWANYPNDASSGSPENSLRTGANTGIHGDGTYVTQGDATSVAAAAWAAGSCIGIAECRSGSATPGGGAPFADVSVDDVSSQASDPDPLKSNWVWASYTTNITAQYSYGFSPNTQCRKDGIVKFYCKGDVAGPDSYDIIEDCLDNRHTHIAPRSELFTGAPQGLVLDEYALVDSEPISSDENTFSTKIGGEMPTAPELEEPQYHTDNIFDPMDCGGTFGGLIGGYFINENFALRNWTSPTSA